MCCEFFLPLPSLPPLRQRFVCVIVLIVTVWLILELQKYGGTSIQETEVEEIGKEGHHILFAS